MREAEEYVYSMGDQFNANAPPIIGEKMKLGVVFSHNFARDHSSTTWFSTRSRCREETASEVLRLVSL